MGTVYQWWGLSPSQARSRFRRTKRAVACIWKRRGRLPSFCGAVVQSFLVVRVGCQRQTCRSLSRSASDTQCNHVPHAGTAARFRRSPRGRAVHFDNGCSLHHLITFRVGQFHPAFFNSFINHLVQGQAQSVNPLNRVRIQDDSLPAGRIYAMLAQILEWIKRCAELGPAFCDEGRYAWLLLFQIGRQGPQPVFRACYTDRLLNVDNNDTFTRLQEANGFFLCGEMCLHFSPGCRPSIIPKNDKANTTARKLLFQPFYTGLNIHYFSTFPVRPALPKCQPVRSASCHIPAGCGMPVFGLAGPDYCPLRCRAAVLWQTQTPVLPGRLHPVPDWQRRPHTASQTQGLSGILAMCSRQCLRLLLLLPACGTLEAP